MHSKKKKEYQKFGKQICYTIIADVIIILLGFIELPILTKGLGAKSYGIWSLINVTISLIFPFALFAFDVSIVRFLAAFQERKEKVKKDFYSAFAIVFISGTVLSILLFLFSPILAKFILKDAANAIYIKIASILILLQALNQLTLGFFRMKKEIGIYTIFNLALNFSQVVLIILAILLGFKLTGVIVAVILAGIIVLSMKGLIIWRKIGFYLPDTLSHMKKYLKWGVPLTPNLAILWIINVSDRYMVSFFNGVAAAGVYSAAYRIADFAKFVLLPLGIVLYPTIIKSYDKGKLKETKHYLKYSLKYFMMISVPSVFGLTLLSKPLLELLTTSEFIYGYTVIPLVSLGAVVFGFYQICLYVIHLVNKTEITIKLLTTAAVLNIVLNLILIPRYGMVGAAIATLFAYVVLGLLTLFVTRKYLKFNISGPFILKSTIASAFMIPLIKLVNPNSIITIIISILGGGLVYFLVLCLIRGLNKKELEFFLGFVKDNVKSNFFNKIKIGRNSLKK